MTDQAKRPRTDEIPMNDLSFTFVLLYLFSFDYLKITGPFQGLCLRIRLNPN